MATGHSARDVYEMLAREDSAREKGLRSGARGAGRLIDRIRYGDAAGAALPQRRPPAFNDARKRARRLLVLHVSGGEGRQHPRRKNAVRQQDELRREDGKFSNAASSFPSPLPISARSACGYRISEGYRARGLRSGRRFVDGSRRTYPHLSLRRERRARPRDQLPPRGVPRARALVPAGLGSRRSRAGTKKF